MALRRLKAVSLALSLGLTLLPACSTTGGGVPAPGSSGTSPAPSAPPPTSPAPGASADPTDPAYGGAGSPSATQGAAPPAIQTGPNLGQRATSALNGMLMGAIIGGQAGPFGAAAGAAILLVYSAITGDVPLAGGGGRGGYGYPGGAGGGYGYPSGQERERERAIEEQIQSEEQRQASLESEIEEELKRQEELLESIDQPASPQAAKVSPGSHATPTEPELRERADPRAAPIAPAERDLPASVYDEQKLTVAAGKWGNDRPLDVKRRSLDADRDGKPEEIVFIEAKSGQMLRKENDLDYDGTIDAWSLYQNGQLVGREVDSDHDGKVDAWETYAGGRMRSREVDRNGDGIRDAGFLYDGDSLVEEWHDDNNDGRRDLVIAYANRHRVRSEEDTDKDGRIDSWTTFATDGNGTDIIVRIEKDPKGAGKATVVETYVQLGGKTVIATREEDVNGDGSVDVKSTYENGKLKNREISDPSVVPL